MRKDHTGVIVAGSLAAGLLAALLLAAAPFIAPEENAITGGILCGFALGWALLALLSERLTEHPQRWAVVPAVFMALGGTATTVRSGREPVDGREQTSRSPAPATPLHRLRQSHGGAGTRCRRLLLGHGVDIARRSL
jgi:hypothetical protein